MSYFILMTITFIVGVLWSENLMPYLKNTEKKFLEFIAKRLEK